MQNGLTAKEREALAVANEMHKQNIGRHENVRHENT